MFPPLPILTRQVGEWLIFDCRFTSLRDWVIERLGDWNFTLKVRE
jgi:hypothetical protein